jgi:hypothetical protein
MSGIPRADTDRNAGYRSGAAVLSPRDYRASDSGPSSGRSPSRPLSVSGQTSRTEDLTVPSSKPATNWTNYRTRAPLYAGRPDWSLLTTNSR